MRCRFAILAGLFLGLWVPAARGESVSSAQVKQATQRAVPFLLDHRDKEIKGQISGGGACVSCHWNGPAIFSLGMAQRRGLVERKEVQKFDNLLKDYSTRKLVYVINDKTIQLLKTGGLPDDKQAALKKKINQHFATPKDLVKELGKDVVPALLDKHEAEIVKLAANPNFYDKIGNAVGSASVLIAGAAAATSSPDQVAKGLAERLTLVQHEDGSFLQAGSQPYFPCDPKEERECDTLWVAIALRQTEGKTDAAVKCLERANAFLLKTKPGKSLVTLMLRSLWAQGMNDAPRVAEFSAEFVKQQRADGGWSSWNWSKQDADSDAWATGMALYTLGVMGRKDTDPNVQKGLVYLLKTQESDGGWTGTNAKGKGARIWSYWGSSWAVVGLMETMPK